MSVHKFFLNELADIIEDTSDQFGNLEVVFVGDDAQGQYVHPYLDVAVCLVTDADGNERQVFALMVNPDLKMPGRRTLLQ